MTMTVRLYSTPFLIFFRLLMTPSPALPDDNNNTTVLPATTFDDDNPSPSVSMPARPLFSILRFLSFIFFVQALLPNNPQFQPHRTTSTAAVRLGIAFKSDVSLPRQGWQPRLITPVELSLWPSPHEVLTAPMVCESEEARASWFIEDWVPGGAPPLGWHLEYMLR